MALATSLPHSRTQGKMRKLRHPEAWVGKHIPRNIEWDGYCVGDYFLCDECRRLFHYDDLHSLLSPRCEADFALQRAMGIEEPFSFCEDCLAKLEREADRIDPDWRYRHRLYPMATTPDDPRCPNCGRHARRVMPNPLNADQDVCRYCAERNADELAREGREWAYDRVEVGR